MLFDFKLRPVDEIKPWGESPDLSLSWFGLTDGFYRLQVGTERLFSSSDQIARVWVAKDPNFSGVYVDYQVVRLWEDLLQILPDVLAPIPPELARWFSADSPNTTDLLQSAKDWLDLEKDPDVLDKAISWIQNRTLDSQYLADGPNIWLWSNDETVTVTWDNRHCLLDGVELWSARCGSYSMPRATFLKEVRRFNDELIGQMQQRVDEISASWNRPHIRIDLEGLRREQSERSGVLDKRKHCQGDPIDLKRVLAAMDEVSKSDAI
ncbi:MAG: DUF5984 family protein [Candidatus Obscuribacterales bacterium]|nr:DUF5984 family protein [Candidatus Obscuribacterales bacterium]